ncbi:hypothetical protein A4X13_0g6011 [Tilletia indica]|uniref:Uncharacterized protein n=1 Tax=Tilletia indica TaxID=43049 RepID=A0A177TG71_9BASI|nr:hypothetical protein A4X13_0g6011 [Tilletia indica]
MSAGPSSSSAGPAIVDTLRWNDFSAQILDSTNTALRLYGVKQEGRLLQAYVEAKEGEQFFAKVDFSKRRSQEIYNIWLRLGGNHITGQVCRPGSWPRLIKDRPISTSSAETLMFAKAAVTDDEVNSIRDPAEVARMGDIDLVLKKVESWKPINNHTFSQRAIGPQQAIYECSKKVGAINFGAGHTVPRADWGMSSCKFDDSFAPVTFKFHCTTRIGLQLLGYIPMEKESKSASSTKKRSREEEDIEAEEKRLKKQLEELNKRRRVLGNAANSNNADTQTGESSISVKNERRKFDFGRGGTADDPLTIADLSD